MTTTHQALAARARTDAAICECLAAPLPALNEAALRVVISNLREYAAALEAASVPPGAVERDALTEIQYKASVAASMCDNEGRAAGFRLIEGIATSALSAPSPAPAKEALLFEHVDGRYAVAFGPVSPEFTRGDPKWVRLGPVDVSLVASPAPAPVVQAQPTYRFWKVGDDLLPFHKAASHVNPDYRDGWNACWYALKNDTVATTQPAEQREPLSLEDADKLATAIEQFEECNETSVDYADLMRFANMGLLECTHFEVKLEAEEAIESARAHGIGVKGADHG